MKVKYKLIIQKQMFRTMEPKLLMMTRQLVLCYYLALTLLNNAWELFIIKLKGETVFMQKILNYLLIEKSTG